MHAKWTVVYSCVWFLGPACFDPIQKANYAGAVCEARLKWWRRVLREEVLDRYGCA